MEREIQYMLPDVLHGTAGPADRARVEAHLDGCRGCRAELNALRAVHNAAVFTPSIDAAGIVRKIPPYGIITPLQERPARSPVAKWLVTAGFVLIAIGGGSAILMQSDPATQARSEVPAPGHSLALAAGLDELSDGGLVQLMTEMNAFDALPADELELMFAEDTSVPVEEDSL